MHSKITIKENLKKETSIFKKKSTAIILSIFLSFFSWLYTYSINKKKFWISLLIVILGLTIFYTALIYSSFTGGIELFKGYGIIIRLILILSNIGVYIWALIDNIRRPRNFYLNYPN